MGFCQAISMLHLSYTTSVLSETIRGESSDKEDMWQRIQLKMKMPNIINLVIHVVLLGLFCYSFTNGIFIV